ncbi:MAG: sialidase family protein [Planctomycetaceae bacterium]
MNRLCAGDPVLIMEAEGDAAPRQPQVCVDHSGTAHLAFGSGSSVFYCQSLDAGQSYSPARKAFSVANMSLGMRRGPRVAKSANSIVITAIGGKEGKGRDGDLQAWRSADEGASWQGPVQVNDVNGSAREGLHAMAAGPDGAIICVWLDLRSKRTEIYASTSTDGGLKWSGNALVYRSPAGSVCECCHPSVVIDAEAVHVMFRNSIGGNRDMYLATSGDKGKTFGPARQLGVDHWSLFACPMDGGMLVVDGDGKAFTAWRRGGELFFTSDDSHLEQPLGLGEQPWIANTPDGITAVWTEGRLGELRIRNLSKPAARTLYSVARDPVIASSPDGGAPVIVCWESLKGERGSVMAVSIATH